MLPDVDSEAVWQCSLRTNLIEILGSRRESWKLGYYFAMNSEVPGEKIFG